MDYLSQHTDKRCLNCDHPCVMHESIGGGLGWCQALIGQFDFCECTLTAHQALEQVLRRNMRIKFTVELVPDDPMGFTWRYLASHIPGVVLNHLTAWLTGQTMAINDKHETIIYAGDVERFFEGRLVID